ncbi:MAG: hypothetical protein ACI9WO_001893, partial [Sphingobacteriales bacterium]
GIFGCAIFGLAPISPVGHSRFQIKKKSLIP